jgi:hypothetical protein
MYVLRNTDPVPICPIRDISTLLQSLLPCRHGASFRIVSAGGGKQILASSVTQLPPRLSRYVFTNLRFHLYITAWFIYSHSGLSRSESSCTFTWQDKYHSSVRKPMESLLSFFGPSVYKHVTTGEQMNRFSRNLTAGNFTKYCDIFKFPLYRRCLITTSHEDQSGHLQVIH